MMGVTEKLDQLIVKKDWHAKAMRPVGEAAP